MLSTIPSVSNKSAIAIMKKCIRIKSLISELENNDKYLDDVKLVSANGQERKISKSCIENVKKFLLA
mgnify:FL=1